MEQNYQTYEKLHEDSLNNSEKFWQNKSEFLHWFKKPKKILDSSKKPFYQWFPDGQFNITYNCLDRHIEKLAKKPAFIYEGPIAKETKQITYEELLKQVELFAGVLKSHNLKKGDRAIIYMPMIIETAIAFLACARIGVIHSMVFGGFSATELASRINDSKPSIIISSSCGLEPHKIIDYPEMIREAKVIVKNEKLLTIYVNRKQKTIEKLQKNEFFWQDEINKANREKATILESTHPLYILYTSGTTGKPKGIYRDHGGTAVGLAVSLEYGFGFTENSKIFATSDFGWVVGHSYIVYGPLLFGATSLIYEGKPIGTPDVGAFFQIIEKYKIDIIYSSPTAIRAIRKEDPEGKIIKKYDINSLKVFGVVGERTDIHTYDFLKKIMPKDCLYNDTYWQTETGWFVSANFMKPQKFQTKGGSCTKAFPGYNIKILGDDHVEIKENKKLGHVVIHLPMPPGFMTSIWENNDFCKQKYFDEFPGYYQTGDAGFFDEDGYLHIMTRTDDVINVAGHRLSTAQMEEVVSSHEDVLESVVVGVKDGLKGQIPYAILVLKKNSKKDHELIFKEIINIVRKQIGPVACLYNFSIVEKLPKTRSGKILRGTIRKILDKEEWVKPATIEDEETLEFIKEISESSLVKREGDLEFEDILTVDLKKVKME